MTTPDTQRALMDVEEVMQETGLSKNTVYKLIAEKQIPSCKLGRSIRVPRQAFLEFLNKQAVQAG